MKDIRICNDENWRKRHWRSLVSSYNPAPWFSYYTDSLSELYNTSFDFLLDWDLRCMDWMIEHLGIDLRYELTTGPFEGNLGHIEKAVWEKGKIDPAASIRYTQVFENKTGFIPGLSILDLLFCEGTRRTLSLLKTQ